MGPDCSIPGHPEVFVIGDLAHLEQNGQPVPRVAPAAMQMGRYLELERARSGDEVATITGGLRPPAGEASEPVERGEPTRKGWARAR